jgi:hypothetical protein
MNRRDETVACLNSLARSTYDNSSTIVLDAGSNDGSVEAVRSSFPAVEIVELVENRGYAGNNNVGIQIALARQADWVFVLNQDTILAPDCIAHLVEAGESDPRIGIVGPMVYHFDEPTVIQSAGGRLDSQWRTWHIGQNQTDQGQFTLPQPVDWISGCAILVRRQVIQQVGMLDERFFLYWEETDWCLRAGKSGWRIVQVPQAKLWHKGVQRDYQPQPMVTYYVTRNRFLMLALHQGPLMAWAFAWGQALRTLMSWTIKPRWRASKSNHRDAMWRGIVDFLHRRWGRMPS